ncbi:MAG: hypothetical protein AAGD10_13105 [Myxococcota bacterium]
MDPRQLDVRTVARNMREGVVKKDQYEQALQALPDLEEASEFVDYESMFQREEAAAPPPPTPVFVNEPASDRPPNYGFGPMPGTYDPGTDGAGGSTI